MPTFYTEIIYGDEIDYDKFHKRPRPAAYTA